jgi:hypothetical protein
MIRTVRASLVMTALAFAAPAAAKVVELDCMMTNGDKDVPWQVSLNEEEGKVTYSHPNATVTRPAQFTPDAVVWDNGSSRAKVSFAISRINLSFSRDVVIGEKTWSDKASCKIAAPKVRAF